MKTLEKDLKTLFIAFYGDVEILWLLVSFHYLLTLYKTWVLICFLSFIIIYYDQDVYFTRGHSNPSIAYKLINNK